MTVLCPFGSPFRSCITNGILDGIQRILDISVQIDINVSEIPLWTLLHPTTANHTRRHHIHRISSHIFAQFIKLMIADSVGTVIRRPFAPLSRTIFNRSERLFPVIHRFFIDSVHDASARETDKAGRKLFQVLNNVFTEYGFSIVPGIGREQGNDIYLKLPFRHRLYGKHSTPDVLFRFQFTGIFCPFPIPYIHFDHIAHPLSPFVNQKYT